MEHMLSHIFCTECAARLGLTNSSGRHEHRNSCPACGSHLTNPDDAVVTELNPSEDYKTSVLSGLSPNVIIECASRALSFWAYQTTQEVVYQEYLGKTLTEKYTNLSVHLDKVINEANSQITSLNNKISNVDLDQQALRRKNDELAQALKEKNKKLLQTQELYDKLKRKAMMGQMQDAAEDAVDSNLQTAARLDGGITGLVEVPGLPGIYQEDGSSLQQHRVDSNALHRTDGGHAFPSATHSPPGSWARTVGAGTNIPVTPSTHRQRLGEPSAVGLTTVPGFVPGFRSPRRAMNIRTPLADVPSNLRGSGKYPAVGLSSGLKSSFVGPGSLDGFAKPQAIQRPAPTVSALGRREPESVIGDIRSASIAGNIRGGFTSR
ncbi:hypothetical protein JX265_011108 [Neoarthrinium moseri]|uniref:Cyclin B1 interacting protein 1 n=1 Tax=Neoarthrinium moseri TaxID=1658444 RepID=A0A9P9WDA3_9PEZI|nr:uncharacterized protein JN550_005089 [Neoarthrinium moseri]KAI1852474.1 hypothetical protein JX266_002652 [Neoarthrinium moseri]KAI1857693.1 hypothetical protein JX265_011108 [Neoarthrinium moseri]KAI1870546.1 hypothetical protein JN550_005089 [Neoarthrinium moseri]